MTTIAGLIFWVCALLIVYGHVGYPVVLWYWAKKRARPPLAGTALPKVTVIVVANNEAGRIRQRIENLLSQDYPQDRLHIVIASDGSTDDTVARAREVSKSVEVVEFEAQRGKPACLNELILAASSEIVVLADARQVFEPSALRALVAPFADPKVGAVSGELLLDVGTDDSNAGPGLYWTYEKFLRKRESEIDSTVGATGAIYAIRRALFEPIPNDTVLDDMLIPCRLVRRGFRVVFESRARAHDRAAEPSAELQRKARTLAGNFQLFSREGWLFNPRENRLWIQTLSHKVLRLAMPLLLLGTLVSSLILTGHTLYTVALIAQLAFYSAAALGALLSPRGKRSKLFKLLSAIHLFCLLHWATVLGFLKFSRGRATAKWKKSSPEPALRIAPQHDFFSTHKNPPTGSSAVP